MIMIKIIIIFALIILMIIVITTVIIFAEEIPNLRPPLPITDTKLLFKLPKLQQSAWLSPGALDRVDLWRMQGGHDLHKNYDDNGDDDDYWFGDIGVDVDDVNDDNLVVMF